jgi:prevent-host-death family protein
MTMGIKSVLTLPAGEFKATCLAVLDEVAESGREVIITKRGKPVARIGPVSIRVVMPLAGSLIHEDDVISPIAVDWNATK